MLEVAALLPPSLLKNAKNTRRSSSHRILVHYAKITSGDAMLIENICRSIFYVDAIVVDFMFHSTGQQDPILGVLFRLRFCICGTRQLTQI